MTAYYNEHDKKAAEWIRELIKAGLVAPGEVDERSIEDVTPNDLKGFSQCHFFAGIAVWSFALRRAGWPDDREVWTGSCPCQPFSAAGKGEGFADERHLWPAWFHLISQRRPLTIFGEQVSSPDGLDWFDLVSADLEGASYTVRSADLCAASVGAPHIRQRLYFVADTRHDELFRRCRLRDTNAAPAKSSRKDEGGHPSGESEERIWSLDVFTNGSPSDELANTSSDGHSRRHTRSIGALGGGESGRLLESSRESSADELGNTASNRRERARSTRSTEERRESRSKEARQLASRFEGSGDSDRDGSLGDSVAIGQQGKFEQNLRRTGRTEEGRETRRASEPLCGLTNGFWRDVEWIYCRDGKYRPVPIESALFPLAARTPGRVGLLRGAGNSIVAPLAEEFIRAYLEEETESCPVDESR